MVKDYTNYKPSTQPEKPVALAEDVKSNLRFFRWKFDYVPLRAKNLRKRDRVAIFIFGCFAIALPAFIKIFAKIEGSVANEELVKIYLLGVVALVYSLMPFTFERMSMWFKVGRGQKYTRGYRLALRIIFWTGMIFLAIIIGFIVVMGLRDYFA